MTKIQSNLYRLHNSSDVKYSFEKLNTKQQQQRILRPKPDINKDQDSSVSSSIDSDSESDSTNASNAGVPTSSGVGTEMKTKKVVTNDLRVSFTKSRNPSKEKVSGSVVERSPTGILREQGPNFLAELEGRVLRLYGSGALKCTETSWEKGATATATTILFQYINYEDIVEIFPRLRVRFPHLENFVFVETNISKCSQLNALAELHQVYKEIMNLKSKVLMKSSLHYR